MESAVISLHPASISPGKIEIGNGASRWALRPDPGTVLARIEEHSYRDHEGRDRQATRLVFAPEILHSPLHIGLEMESA